MMLFARNPKAYEIFSKKRVSLVGCGSVGSALGEMLVRAGIGELWLTDPDTLAPENLSRHVLTSADLGRPKAEALADRFRAINPDLKVSARVRPFEQTVHAASVFASARQSPKAEEKPDLYLSAVDSYRCESMVNGQSLRQGVPALYVGCWGEASVGEILYVVPGQTACYECFAAFRSKVEIPPDARKYTDPDFDETRVPGQAGLWANILAISGVAFQAILGLVGLRPELIDDEHTLWLMNVSDYESELKPLAVTFATVQKGCAICD